MANLFDIYKEFRRGGTILSVDFNDLQNSLVGSFKKLGTERADSKNGVEGTFSVAEPIESTNATTKGYVDQSIIANLAQDGATGPRGPTGPVGPSGQNLVLSGTVTTASGLNNIDADQGDVYVAKDTDIAYVYDSGSWIDIGQFGGPPGPTGAAGTNGSNGAKGNTGNTGANGTNGSQGSTGPQGPRGYTGSTGPAGSYNGPNVQNGSTFETLFWNGAWVATGALKVGYTSVTIPGIAKGSEAIVTVTPTGTLSSVLIPSTLLEMDSKLKELNSSMEEMHHRLGRVENKI